MIKLERQNCPSPLNDHEYVEAQTRLFKETQKKVWGEQSIKNELLKLSNNKCCYCETRLNEEGKDMQVEHFHPKKHYPDEVLVWSNLLPSCNRCNRNKSSFDTGKEPIIDPTTINPKKYLYMDKYRYKSIDHNELGQRTIDLLCLNDLDGLTYPRFKIGESVQDKLSQILYEASYFAKEMSDSKLTSNNEIKIRNKLLKLLKGTLREARPSEEYCATVATTIYEDSNYPILKALYQSFDLWDDELDSLDCQIQDYSLAKKVFSDLHK